MQLKLLKNFKKNISIPKEFDKKLKPAIMISLNSETLATLKTINNHSRDNSKHIKWQNPLKLKNHKLLLLIMEWEQNGDKQIGFQTIGTSINYLDNKLTVIFNFFNNKINIKF